MKKYICQHRPHNRQITTYLFGYEADNPGSDYLQYRKSPEIKTFRENQNTYSGNAHCIKDRVLLDEIYESGGFMAWAKNKSEVIWSEQRSI